uniref:Disks large-associated protein 1 n=2 Tax=Graphocephala atropunctata TaxID=36148 RepID=A0A1B6MCT3_9HEMI
MVSPEALTDGSLNHNHADNSPRVEVETTNTNAQVDNSNTNIRIPDGVKQPSYLNLACCISGYTTLTTYNSKQREGFRSRDISPSRIAGAGSAGVSPHGVDDASNPPVYTSICGNFLSPQSRYLTEMDHRRKSGDKMWNGNGAADKVSSSTFTSSSTTMSGNSSFYRCETRREVSSSTYQSESVSSQNKEVPPQGSSFILQRVERLYGPGALAQGFYTRRSLNASLVPQKEAPEEVIAEATKESALPVLRLLRPEFRAQLTLAKRKSHSPVCSPNRALDTTDGAVERIIPIVVEGNDETSNSKVLEERETATTSADKDGQYYLKLVLTEAERLKSLATEMEAEVSSVPEHMEGRLRAAAGKAKLLASQKLAQFKGLCHKNINQDTSEDFPTTCEDLAGFWDMVSIQVASVHEEFKELDILRKAGWPEQNGDEDTIKKEAVSNGSGSSRRTKLAPVQAKANPVKSNASKARDEARKRMLAERRMEMRKNANACEDIVIV